MPKEGKPGNKQPYPRLHEGERLRWRYCARGVGDDVEDVDRAAVGMVREQEAVRHGKGDGALGSHLKAVLQHHRIPARTRTMNGQHAASSDGCHALPSSTPVQHTLLDSICQNSMQQCARFHDNNAEPGMQRVKGGTAEHPALVEAVEQQAARGPVQVRAVDARVHGQQRHVGRVQAAGRGRVLRRGRRGGRDLERRQLGHARARPLVRLQAAQGGQPQKKLGCRYSASTYCTWPNFPLQAMRECTAHTKLQALIADGSAGLARLQPEAELAGAQQRQARLGRVAPPADGVRQPRLAPQALQMGRYALLVDVCWPTIVSASVQISNALSLMRCLPSMMTHISRSSMCARLAVGAERVGLQAVARDHHKVAALGSRPEEADDRALAPPGALHDRLRCEFTENNSVAVPACSRDIRPAGTCWGCRARQTPDAWASAAASAAARPATPLLR